MMSPVNVMMSPDWDDATRRQYTRVCERMPRVHLSRTAHVSTRHGRRYDDDDIGAEALGGVVSGHRVSVTASGAILTRVGDSGSRPVGEKRRP